MNNLSRVFCSVTTLLTATAWAADTHRIDILFDTSASMHQSKDAVVSTLQTLTWSLVLAAEQDQIDDVALSLLGFCEEAKHVEVAATTEFNAKLLPKAVAALNRRGHQCMGREDGLNAVDVALAARPESASGHLLLISDEPRSVVNDKVNQIELLQQLFERQLVLDVIVSTQFRCADGRRAMGITNKNIGYVLDESGAFSMCTDAKIEAARASTVTDYVSVALASGGSAWDIKLLGRNSGGADKRQAIVDAMAQGYTSAVLNRARWADSAVSFMSRPTVSALRVSVGDPVNLDGRQSRTSSAELAMSEWQWDIDGDGNADYYGPDGYHIYYTSGYHPITLQVVDTLGKRDSSTVWIEVYDSATR